LILTNLFEFRLYRDNILIDAVGIQRPLDLFSLKTITTGKKEEEHFKELIEKFFSFSLPKEYTPESLAVILAKKTRFLKDILIDEIKNNSKDIIGFYDVFKKFLINELTENDFADLYAQTVTYGLFASRLSAKGEFSREKAFFNIPKSLGILRDIFRFISLEEIPEQMKWIIDDISNVLSIVDVKNIFDFYYHEKKGKDPVIYFYETFLAAYDPEEREKRGVYYTPDPIVSYIVRSLNIILKEKFNIPDGFASPDVTVLDPAAGTLSFLEEAMKLATSEFIGKHGEGGKKEFIKGHILKNFYAFELMMAPYAIGHIRLSFLLNEEGYELHDDERINCFLTNTLEMKEVEVTNIPGTSSLSEESIMAGKVKKEVPILVIMGNPPYSGTSYNRGKWISDVIKEYYQIEGVPLKEKNPKWLQDDYVKFIRFAQWKIDERGNGIIGYITNHSYLDNPTFRGMRYSLLKSFDEIYILNLHGNSLKKETAPDGGKDENVFDIRQGVAISFFVKKKNFKGGKKVYYADLYGLRDDKYKHLLDNDLKTIKWQELKPHEEFYLFVPRNEDLLEDYENFVKITDIFPVNSVGIVTSRDNFVIGRDKKVLENRILNFKNSNLSDDDLHTFFQINKKKGWSIRKAWNSLQSISDSDLSKYILPVLYRPFDVQWIFYHDDFIERSRKEVMRHMMQENLGLLIKRQNRRRPFSYAFISDLIVESCVFESAFANNTICPLYLYPSSDKNALFEEGTKPSEKTLNISPELFEKFYQSYGKSPSPEEIFYYIYAVLYSNVYRAKYAEFLKMDFPRVPFTSDYEGFKEVSKLGESLVCLHLLKSPDLDSPISKYQGKGLNLVEKVIYGEPEKRIYINKDNYFDNIDKEVFEYQIGGYRVLSKWLKDRKGRYLSLEEITTYSRIVAALRRTIETQQQIDEIYPEIEKSSVEFN
jgi:predicted helicase